MLKSTINLIKKNIYAIAAFELVYKTLGALIVYPVITLSHQAIIRLTGMGSITHDNIREYFSNPFIITFIIIAAFIVGIYFGLESFFFYVLFTQKEKRGIKDILKKSLYKLKRVLTKVRIGLIIPIMLIVGYLELIQLAGPFVSINIPYSAIELALGYKEVVFGGIICILVLFYLANKWLFSGFIYASTNKSAKHSLKESSELFKKNRLRVILTTLLLGILFLFVTIVIYLLITMLITLIVKAFYSSSLALGLILPFISIFNYVYYFISLILVYPLFFAAIYVLYERIAENIEVDVTLEETVIVSDKLKFVCKLIIYSLLVANIVTIMVSSFNGSLNSNLIYNRPLIIGHRGYPTVAPENTIASIKEAEKNFADMVEFDIQLTKDDKFILFHDSTLSKENSNCASLGYCGYNISSLTSEEITKVSAGKTDVWGHSQYKDEKIPLLEDVVAAVGNDIILNIELKSGLTYSVEKAIYAAKQLEILINNNLFRNKEIVVTSCYDKELEYLKEQFPLLKTIKVFAGFLTQDIKAAVDKDYYDIIGIDYRYATDYYVKEIKKLGKKVYIWTCNNEKDIKDAIILGADGLITDYVTRAHHISHKEITNHKILRLIEKILYNK